jgi:hypothetical protein
MNKRLWTMRIAMVLALAFLSFAAAIGKLQRVVGVLGPDEIEARDQRYLRETLHKSTAAFVTTSVIKGGIDVIQSVTGDAQPGGIRVTAKIGKVADAVDDDVDVLWAATFTSCVTTEGMRLALPASRTLASSVLFATTLIALFSLISSWSLSGRYRIRTTLRDLTTTGIVATLALYYLLPLSILGASILSRDITAPIHEDAQSQLRNLEQELKFVDNEDWRTRIRELPGRVSHAAAYVANSGKDLVKWTFKEIAAYFFDCIIFPLSVFFLLYRLTRGIVVYAISRTTIAGTAAP